MLLDPIRRHRKRERPLSRFARQRSIERDAAMRDAVINAIHAARNAALDAIGRAGFGSRLH